MILSMTGFGRSEVNRNGISVSVEMKSVNSKFLEIALKLPSVLQSKELEIRELVRSKITRGRVIVSVDFKSDLSSQPVVKINFDVANAFIKELRKLKRKTKVKGEIKLEHLLELPRIFEFDSVEEISENDWELVKNTIEQAIEELVQSKRREGIELAKDINARLDVIANDVDRIISLSSEKIKERQVKLREKIEMLFKDVEFDRNRLEAELVLLADKLDVTEECVRLKSHIKFFREILNGEEVVVGRRLNFLLQEMLREATTIGAKSDDVEVTHLVVELKEEIEKIREQLQNVE